MSNANTESAAATTPDLMTSAEVEALLRVSRTTLHRWRKDGTLQAVKVGRTVRYHRGDVLDILSPIDHNGANALRGVT